MAEGSGNQFGRMGALVKLGHGAAPPVTVTWNPLDKGANITLSNGNLTASKLATDAGWTTVRATLSKSTGKRYFEYIMVSGAHSEGDPGLSAAGGDVSQRLGAQGVTSYCVTPNNTGVVETTFVDGTAAAVTLANNDVIGIAVDFDTGKVWMAQNNDYTKYSGGAANPVTGAAPRVTFTPNTPLFPAASLFGNSDGTIVVTLVASGTFAFAPPTGFVAWTVAAASALLLENASYLLLENGSRLLL